MGITLKKLNKEIKAVSPYLSLAKGDGYYYFYSDDKELGLFLSGLPTTGVYVYKLNQLTLDEWVKEASYLLQGYIS